jgi:hypothetical protein
MASVQKKNVPIPIRTSGLTGSPPENLEQSEGNHHMPGKKWMDRLRAESVGRAMLQLFCEPLMCFHVKRIEFLREPVDRAEVIGKQSKNVAPQRSWITVAADVERINKDDASVGVLASPLQDLAIQLLIPIRRERPCITAKRAVQIVNTDLDRQPVRSVDDYIIVPSVAKVLDRVAADSLVEIINLTVGVPSRDEINASFDIPTAVRSLICTPSAIRDAVPNEDDLLSRLNRKV